MDNSINNLKEAAQKIEDEYLSKQAKIRIENLDGTFQEFLTDRGSTYGLTAIGYSFRYENGRQMIIHPNSVYRLIIDEIGNRF